jgi:hypothetical protein
VAAIGYGFLADPIDEDSKVIYLTLTPRAVLAAYGADGGPIYEAHVRSKGRVSRCVVAALANLRGTLGFVRMTLQTDGEPAIVDLA